MKLLITALQSVETDKCFYFVFAGT